MYIVELFPPGWMGRSFQLLALAAAPQYLLRSIELDIAVFSSKDDFIEALSAAYSIAAGLVSDKLVQAPRMFGNDYKPVEKLIDRKLAKEEKKWDIATQLVVERLVSGLLDPDKPRVVPLAIMKLNLFEKARTMKGGKPLSGEIGKIAPSSLALALVGGLLSKLGRIDDKGVYVAPLPEAGKDDLETVMSIYSIASMEGVSTGLEPLGRLLARQRIAELPVSLDTLLVLYVASLVAELLDAEPGELCGASSALDQLLLASISEGGNRPILNELSPLAISEPLCVLGSAPLRVLGSLLCRAISRGLCRGEQDPGREAIGHCLGKLFLYTITGNNIYLYDCARLLRGAAESNACEKIRGSLLWAARSVAEAATSQVLYVA